MSNYPGKIMTNHCVDRAGAWRVQGNEHAHAMQCHSNWKNARIFSAWAQGFFSPLRSSTPATKKDPRCRRWAWAAGASPSASMPAPAAAPLPPLLRLHPVPAASQG